MARSSWKSLFGCFSSHSAAAAAASGRSNKKNKKKTKVAAAGSGSKPRRPSRSLHGRMSFSDLSLNGGMVSPEDLSLSLVGSNLHIFTIAELRANHAGFPQGVDVVLVTGDRVAALPRSTFPEAG